MTHSFATWLIHVWHDSFMVIVGTPGGVLFLCGLISRGGRNRFRQNARFYISMKFSLLRWQHLTRRPSRWGGGPTINLAHDKFISTRIQIKSAAQTTQIESFMCDVTHLCIPFVCDMTHSCVTRLIHVWYYSLLCDMTHSCIHVWHDNFMCDMTQSRMTWLPQVQHDSFVCDMTHSCVTWLIRVSLTHSYRACTPTVSTQKNAPADFFSISSSSVPKHWTLCLLASIFLLFDVIFFVDLFCWYEGLFCRYTALFCLDDKGSFRIYRASVLDLPWCNLIFGHRIWVEWIWASLKERWIALHLICALYAI